MTAQLTLYSTVWCGDCRRLKGYLDSRSIEYNDIDIETDESAAEWVIKINGGMRSIPVIVFPDGTHLTEPSNKAVEEKLAALAIV